jgi:hypothetical protein
MEYGLANPMWGYWFSFFRRVDPRHVVLRAQDFLAAAGELVMGAAMIVFPFRGVGAVICALSFLYLVPLIRLGRLSVLMAMLPLILLPELPISLPAATEFPIAVAPGWPAQLQAILLIAYLGLLPAVKIVQYANLFKRRAFPAPIQRGLMAYWGFVPIIMWRVFTADVTNFFIRIYAVDVAGHARAVVHEDGVYAYRELRRWPSWSARFLHVTESIALTTVFTTLKYFPSRRDLFEQRLIDYARSLRLPEPAAIRFDYVAIRKSASELRYEAVTEFTVVLETGVVTEHKLVTDFDYSRVARHSHVRESTGFGSYLPRS